MKIKVIFQARFETTIEAPDLHNVYDAIADIDVPENEQSKYVSESFEPISLVTEDGKTVHL